MNHIIAASCTPSHGHSMQRAGGDLLHEFKAWGSSTAAGKRATSLMAAVPTAIDPLAFRLNETGGGFGDELATAYLWGLILSDPDTVTT